MGKSDDIYRPVVSCVGKDCRATFDWMDIYRTLSCFPSGVHTPPSYSPSLQLIVKEVYILHDIVCVQNFFTIYEKGLIRWVICYGSKA
jgi:hypothetical protein